MATPGTFNVRLIGRLRMKNDALAHAKLFAWETAEGPFPGGAWLANNPLNTTRRIPGHMTTRVGTRIPGYDSEAVGVEATALTLEQGNFAPLLAALRSGTWNQFRAAVVASPWAGGHYNHGRSFPTDVAVRETDTPYIDVKQGVRRLGNIVAAPVKAAMSLGEFLAILSDGHTWVRIGEATLGALLLASGLMFVARDLFGASVAPSPVAVPRAAARMVGRGVRGGARRAGDARATRGRPSSSARGGSVPRDTWSDGNGNGSGLHDALATVTGRD